MKVTLSSQKKSSLIARNSFPYWNNKIWQHLTRNRRVSDSTAQTLLATGQSSQPRLPKGPSLLLIHAAGGGASHRPYGFLNLQQVPKYSGWVNWEMPYQKYGHNIGISCRQGKGSCCLNLMPIQQINTYILNIPGNIVYIFTSKLPSPLALHT